MPQTDNSKHVPASRTQIEEAVWTLMRKLPLHPDAPVVPGVTDHPDFKRFLVTDLTNAVEAKRPSIFVLNTSVQALLAVCTYFPHRDEILTVLERRTDKMKKRLA